MNKIYTSIKKGITYKYLSFAFSLISTGIISRIFSPADFGSVIAIVTMFVLINIVAEMGIGYLVIANSLPKKIINNLFTLTIIIASIIFFLINISKYWFVEFILNKNALNTISILSLSIFFNILNIMPGAILLKYEKFNYIAITSIVTEIISTTTIWLLSFKFISPELLAIKYAITSISIFYISIYFLKRKIKFQFEIDLKMKKLIFYIKPNLYTTGFNCLNYFNRSLDNMLVVDYMGPSALGIYDKAYSLMQYPIQAFSAILEKTLLPSLSAAGNIEKKEVLEIHNNLVTKLSIYGVIASISMYSLSKYFVLILYGEQWGGVEEVLRVFCIAIPIQCIMHTSSSFYYYYGKYKLLYYNGIISILFMIPIIIFGVFSKDLLILAAWIVIGLHINFFIIYYILYKKIFNTQYIEFLIRCKYMFFYEAVVIFINYYKL